MHCAIVAFPEVHYHSPKKMRNRRQIKRSQRPYIFPLLCYNMVAKESVVGFFKEIFTEMEYTLISFEVVTLFIVFATR